MKKQLLKTISNILFLVCSLSVFAGTQTITINPSSPFDATDFNNPTITLTTVHSFATDSNVTNDINTIGFQLFYDSSVIQFESVTDLYGRAVITSPVNLVEPTSGTADRDSDADTDRFINAVWVNLSGTVNDGDLTVLTPEAYNYGIQNSQTTIAATLGTSTLISTGVYLYSTGATGTEGAYSSGNFGNSDFFDGIFGTGVVNFSVSTGGQLSVIPSPLDMYEAKFTWIGTTKGQTNINVIFTQGSTGRGFTNRVGVATYTIQGPPLAPSSATITIDPVDFVADETTSFTVNLTDANGDPTSNSSGLTFASNFANSSFVINNVTSAGVATIDYSSVVSGSHDIGVYINGSLVGTRTITVQAGVAVTSSIQLGVDRAVIDASVIATITLRDTNNNLTDGNLRISVDNSANSTTPVANGTGTYNTTITNSVAGLTTITAMVDGVSDSSTAITFVAPANFTLAQNTVNLTKNASNTIRYQLAITDIIDQGVVENNTFSISTTGDNIFTTNPAPVVSFTTNAIVTTMALSNTPTTANLYFTVIPDAIGTGLINISLQDTLGNTTTKSVTVTVIETNSGPVITNAFDSRLFNVSVFGGSIYADSALGTNGNGSAASTFQGVIDDLGGHFLIFNSSQERTFIDGSIGFNTSWYGIVTDKAISSNDSTTYPFNLLQVTDSATQIYAQVTADTVYSLYPGFYDREWSSTQPSNEFANGTIARLMSQFVLRQNNSGFGGRKANYEFPNGFTPTTTITANTIIQGNSQASKITTLSGFDLDGDNVSWSGTSASGGTVTFSQASPNSAISTTDVMFQPSNDFAGTTTVIVSLTANNKTINATINITIIPVASASDSSFILSSNTATVGNVIGVTITIMGRNNDNSLTSTTGNVTVTLNNGSGFLSATSQTGIYSLSVSNNTAGTTIVTIAVDGAVIGTQNITFNPDIVSASNSTISGNANTNLTADGSISFNVQLRDRFGNNVSGSITTNASSLGVDITIASNTLTGVATVVYTTNLVGADTIVISVNGVTIATRTITVTHGVLASVVLTPNNFTLLSSTANTETFTAELKDANGNIITTSSNVTFSENSNGSTVTLSNSNAITTTTGLASVDVTSIANAVGDVVITADAITGGVSLAGSVDVSVQIFGFNLAGDAKFLVNESLLIGSNNFTQLSSATTFTLEGNIGSIAYASGSAGTITYSAGGVAGVATLTSYDSTLSSNDVIVINVYPALSIAISADAFNEIAYDIRPMGFESNDGIASLITGGGVSYTVVTFNSGDTVNIPNNVTVTSTNASVVRVGNTIDLFGVSIGTAMLVVTTNDIFANGSTRSATTDIVTIVDILRVNGSNTNSVPTAYVTIGDSYTFTSITGGSAGTGNPATVSYNFADNSGAISDTSAVVSLTTNSRVVTGVSAGTTTIYIRDVNFPNNTVGNLNSISGFDQNFGITKRYAVVVSEALAFTTTIPSTLISGDSLNFAITGGGGDGSADITVSVDNGIGDLTANNGTYTFAPTATGVYTLVITDNESGASTSTMITIVPGAVVGTPTSTMTGDENTVSLIAGNSAAALLITLKDNAGNLGNDTISPVVNGGNTTYGSYTITPNPTTNAFATFTYTADKVGTDIITFWVNSSIIATRTYATAHGALSSVVLTPNNFTLLSSTANTETFTAKLQDADGNLITTSSNITFSENSNGSTVTLSNSNAITTTTGLASVDVTSIANAVGDVVITADVSSGGVSLSGSVDVSVQIFGFNLAGDAKFLVNESLLIGSNNFTQLSSATTFTLEGNIGSIAYASGSAGTITYSAGGIAGVATLTSYDSNLNSNDVIVINVYPVLSIVIRADAFGNTTYDSPIGFENSDRISQIITGGGVIYDSSNIPTNVTLTATNASVVQVFNVFFGGAISTGTTAFVVTTDDAFANGSTRSATTDIITIVDALLVNGDSTDNVRTAYITLGESYTFTGTTGGSAGAGNPATVSYNFADNSGAISDTSAIVSLTTNSRVITGVSAGITTIYIRDVNFPNNIVATTGTGNRIDRDVGITKRYAFIVSEALAFTTTLPSTLISGSSLNFAITGGGGDGSADIIASVDRGSLTDNGNGNYTFIAPTTGAFAGDYVITITDNDSGFTTTHTVNVPLGISLRAGILAGAGSSDLANAVIEITGADTTDSIVVSASNIITIANDNITAVAVGGQNIASTTISSVDLATFNPDSLTAVAITVTSGSVETNSSINVVPAQIYTGVVTGASNANVTGAYVAINTNSNLLIIDTSDENGEFRIIAPKLNSGFYDITVEAQGYVLETFSGASYANDTNVVISLTAQINSVTGTITNAYATQTQTIFVQQVGSDITTQFVNTGSTYTLGLVIGSYNIYIEALGFFRTTQVVDVTGGDQSQNFTLFAKPTTDFQAIFVGNELTITDANGDTDFTNSRASLVNFDSVVLSQTRTTDSIVIVLTDSVLATSTLIPISSGSVIVFVYQYIANASQRYSDNRVKVPDDKLGGSLRVSSSNNGFSVVFDDTIGNIALADTAVVRSLQADLPPEALNIAGISRVFVTLTPVNLATRTNRVATGSDGTFFRLDISVLDISDNIIIANKEFVANAEIEITMDYDSNLISRDDWINGRYAVYHADDINDLEAGNYEVILINADDIDDINARITFTVSSLSGFSIGSTVSSGGSTFTSSSGSGGGCSLATNSNSSFDPMLILLILLSAIYLYRRRKFIK